MDAASKYERKPAVAIYREELLPESETFIAAQGYSLRRYAPFFAGLTWRDNSLVAPADAIIAHDGFGAGLARALHRRLDTLPRRFIQRIAVRTPCLFHAHFGIDGISALGLARRLDTPLVVTFHGFDATVRDDILARGPWTHRRYLRRRHWLVDERVSILAVSGFIRQRLLQTGFPEDRVRVHYTGVDTIAFRPPQSPQERPPHVVFVARLVAKKGVMHLINAARTLEREIPSLQLSIVGDGPERATAEDAALGMRAVRFLGAQSPANVRTLLASARVFCVPSLTAPSGDAEGFGMVFAEAQAMGVPVVSFRSGGVPEAVRDGVSGLLAKEGDTSGLTAALRTLLSLRFEDWARFSVAATRHVLDNFSLERQTARLESFYDEVRRTGVSTSTSRPLGTTRP